MLFKVTFLGEISKGMDVKREEKKSKTKFSGSPKVKRSGIQNRNHSQTKWSECCKKVTVTLKNVCVCVWGALFHSKRNKRDIAIKYISQTWI